MQRVTSCTNQWGCAGDGARAFAGASCRLACEVQMKKRKEGKLEAKYTVKACLSELGQIRAVYKKSLRGHKDEFRKTMQSTQRVIFRLRKDHTLRNDFKRSVLAERKKMGKASKRKFLLSLEAVAMATGATSRNSRQIASKRAKALDYLRTTGVKVADTARTIKAKRGVDKILAEATIARRETDKPNGAGGQQQLKKAGENHERARRNDQELSVPVWMRMSDRDQIRELPVGARLRLVGTRVGQDAGDVKITKIEADVEAASQDWAH